MEHGIEGMDRELGIGGQGTRNNQLTIRSLELGLGARNS